MPALSDYPLSGVHLIEASAGTGKTYTISALFVRLLLERGLSVRQILVVTYTKAATEDLRLRVRQMVSNCLQAFVAGKGQDDFQRSLLATVQDHEQAGRCLLSALQDFDEAAIFTIHAFCQRMLKENSLESGALFDTELVPDMDDLLYEIAADFWRLQMDRFPASFTSYVRKKVLPDNLFLFLKKVQPGLLLLPEVDSAVLDDIAQGGVVEKAEQEISASLAALYQSWPQVGSEVGHLLLESTDLNRNSYRLASIPQWLTAMDAFCRAKPVYRGELPESFHKFSADSLARATKKNGSTPQHSFFDLCSRICSRHDQMQELFRQGLIALRQEAGRYGLAEFTRRKMEKNIFAYDDLLRKLQQALQGSGRQMLALQILNRFPAALIDEFQDTDPIQYEIFSTLYQGAGENLLYIIGDPKQAIYSFRGADIFTYLTAIGDVPSAFELTENYRSEPGLIRAVNTLFSASRNPFVFDRIGFQPVAPAAKKQSPLTLRQRLEPPLQLWQIMRGPGEQGPMTKEVAQERILASLAREIGELLALGNSGEALIGDEAVGPRDIAVLVRENREARLVQQALQQVGIAAVQQSMEDLFASREAAEVERVLSAVAEPGSEKRLRSALATDLLGGTCADLATLEQDEKTWSHWFASFLSYRRCWQEKGFMAMFRQLLDSHHVRVQLLRFVDGERRLTNVLHLAEVLHSRERQKKASPAALLAWLVEQKADGKRAVEEHQLRLESDAERVQIVTIHRSKGLQYPIVFCPFCWGGVRAKGDMVSFHLPTDDHLPAMDLGSEDLENHKELARQEELAENMRLLYVALTRAVHRCYLVWGCFNGAETSALAWLLHGKDDFVGLKKRFKKLSDEELVAELAEMISRSDGSVELSSRRDELQAAGQRAGDEQVALVCRSFAGEIVAQQVTSFSAITSHGRLGESFVPREELAEQRADDDSIFAFPRGAAPGTFLHDVLEHLDFPLVNREPDTVQQLIEKKLAQHGFASKWRDAVMSMIINVLATPLLPDQQDLVLQDVDADKRLNELEFCFPLAAVSAPRIKEILAAYGFSESAASRLEFSVGKGFLKGFIDLVFSHDGRFYLVDWKSNHLGFKVADYHQDRLQEVMLQERYTLQYLLYTLALHHYLAQRITDYSYEDHFGGLFYLFLRGVSRQHGPTYGIYHDRPDARLVEQLSRVLVTV